jgi:serine/threonine-protein kinase
VIESLDEGVPRVCPQCGTRYRADAAFCRRDGARLYAQGARDPRIGQSLLGQFRIEEKIGEGGMGTVYRAHQTTLDRDVAIKILHAELATNADAVHRFEREARISTSLDHPNVVRVYLSGRLPDGSLFLVMELLRGRALADVLRLEPRLPLPRVLHVLGQICAGIAEAHDQGIIHRDVKPENVMIITKGREYDYVKVVDFGIARVTRSEEQTQATQAGLVVGTVRYISPEGAAGAPTDARSDVYSIGVLAYQLLTGTVPFDAAMPVGVLMKHLHEPPLPIRMRPGTEEVPPGVADVVMRALSKNPIERPADAGELGEMLRDAARAAGVPERRMREPSQRTSITRIPQPPPPTPTSAPATSTTGGFSWLSAFVGAAAFALGVALVIGLVVWVRASAPPTPEELRQQQVNAAEAALVAHRWDGADGVGELTDRILAEYPGDADATRVRHDAALLILREGDHERALSQHREARARYERAEAMDPTCAAHERIAELDREAPARAQGIVVSTTVEHVQATITATTAEGAAHDATAAPTFVITQTRRQTSATVPATAASEGSWTATYTFPLGGPYQIEFHDGTTRFATTIEVTRSPHTAHVP